MTLIWAAGGIACTFAWINWLLWEMERLELSLLNVNRVMLPAIALGALAVWCFVHALLITQ